jgi:hypothetical protein
MYGQALIPVHQYRHNIVTDPTTVVTVSELVASNNLDPTKNRLLRSLHLCNLGQMEDRYMALKKFLAGAVAASAVAAILINARKSAK